MRAPTDRGLGGPPREPGDDLDGDYEGIEETKHLGLLATRPPAEPKAWYGAITRGSDVGAATDLIAASIAAGCVWRVGPAALARSPIGMVIWLSPLDLPYEKQMAAWWESGPQPIDACDKATWHSVRIYRI